MALNLVGDEKRQQPAPVTLPKFVFREPNIEAEIKEAAARVGEQRTIRQGVECWQAIAKAGNFESWKAIGAALAVGKAYALRVTGANQAWGRNYSRVFGEWMKEHRFDRRMPPSVRSVAIDLHKHIDQIESWRSTLPEHQRRRLIHPLSVTRRWRAAMAHGKAKCPEDLKRDARAAWRRFVAW